MITSPTARVAPSSIASTARSAQPENVELAKPGARKLEAAVDQISIENAGFLRTALDREPEIRADVVARAKALAADPAYPPLETLRAVADQILRSPDLSEDLS